jgi:hypothetical protein
MVSRDDELHCGQPPRQHMHLFIHDFWTRSYLLGFRVIRIPEKSSAQFGRKEEDRCTLHITYFFLPDLVRVCIDSSPDLVRVRSLTSSTHSREGCALQTKSASILLPPLALTAAAASTPSQEIVNMNLLVTLSK